jgi:hypothetical protein
MYREKFVSLLDIPIAYLPYTLTVTLAVAATALQFSSMPLLLCVPPLLLSAVTGLVPLVLLENSPQLRRKLLDNGRFWDARRYVEIGGGLGAGMCCAAIVGLIGFWYDVLAPKLLTLLDG